MWNSTTEHPAATGKTDRSASVCDEDALTKEPQKKRQKLEEDGDGRHLHEPSASVGLLASRSYTESCMGAVCIRGSPNPITSVPEHFQPQKSGFVLYLFIMILNTK